MGLSLIVNDFADSARSHSVLSSGHGIRRNFCRRGLHGQTFADRVESTLEADEGECEESEVDGGWIAEYRRAS